MAQNEIKKVITVDLGNTSTTLKEYKKHIDDLRGSLLQLDETSEEYNKIAQEIVEEQNKLNDVMKVGKQTTDAAEGSYNQLAQTMSELKKQWKATGDEAERNELGAKILDINNQLKELDASTGNYQRNVGDYANAFEQAFDKCLDGIITIDGPLGELGGTVKNMIPIIKAVNATAISGLSGIKKAIASTGIGLLIVAVATLIAHWEDLKKVIGKVVGVQDTYTQSVEASKAAMEELKNEIKAANKEITFQSNLLAAQGATRLEILQNELTDEQKIVDDLWKQYNRKIDFYNLYKDAGAKSQRQAAELRKQEADAIYEQIKAQDELIKNTKNNIKIQEATLEKSAKDRIKAIEESLLSEQEKLRIQYEKDLELAKQYGLDTLAITEKYNKDLAALNEKASKDKQNAKKTDSEILLEQEKKEAEQIIERVHKSTTDELTLLEETYNKEKALLEKLGKDTTELTQEYEDNRKKIIQKEEDEIQALETERYKNIKNRFDAEAEQLKFEAELEITNEQELADAKYRIEQDYLNRKIAAQELYIEEYNGTQEGLIEAEEQLDAYRQQYANNQKQYEKDSADYAKKKADEVKAAKIASLQATLGLASTVFGSMADLAEEGSEEQKNLQIAETTINTLSGAIGAFMQGMSSYPQPWGAIIGAAGAATATAAGIAQIAKIKSINKDNGSASISSPSISTNSMTAVSPLLDETSDLNRMNMSGMQGNSSKEQQNLRVYVVDQDIRDANNKAEVVEENATF